MEMEMVIEIGNGRQTGKRSSNNIQVGVADHGLFNSLVS